MSPGINTREWETRLKVDGFEKAVRAAIHQMIDDNWEFHHRIKDMETLLKKVIQNQGDITRGALEMLEQVDKLAKLYEE